MACCIEVNFNMKDSSNHSSFTIELDEILEDLYIAKRQKESFFQACFIDVKPKWRELRYRIFLHHLLASLKNETLSFEMQQAFNHIHENASLAYEKLVTSYRKASQNKQIDHEFAYHFYTAVSMHTFCKKLMHLIKASAKYPLKDASLSASLFHTRECIKNAPRALKIPFAKAIHQFFVGQFNFNYDPQIQENTPYKLFDYEINSKKIPILRMGTQTIENYLAPLTSQASINPEFISFLEYLKANEKKHLYINLQNKNPCWIGNNEAPRCRALEELAKEYPDNLIFIGLAKNSVFYHQEDSYKDQNKAFLFKEQFLQQFFHPDGGFAFINTIHLTHTDETLSSIIEEVHHIHFHAKPFLSREERLNFIELTYLYIEKRALELFMPDSANLSCKDGIDRAGGATALLYFDYFFKGKQELSSDQLQDLEAILFAPALLVKKRAITKNRFLRFISAANHLTRNRS